MKYCLVGKKKRDLIYEAVELATPDAAINEQDLISRAAHLQSKSVTEKDTLPLVDDEFASIESLPIFLEVLTSSKESNLTPLINELNNLSWVEQGSKFITEKSLCPFCQKDLGKDFLREFELLFDKIYKQKIVQIEKAKSDYSLALEKIETTLESDKFKVDGVQKNIDFRNAKEKLISILKANKSSIENKFNNPSHKISLKTSMQEIVALNNSIKAINSEITKDNNLLKDRKNNLNIIETEFWSMLASKYEENFNQLKISNAAKNLEISNLETQQSALNDQIEEQERVIIENREKTQNLEKAKIAINKRLTFLGLEGFELQQAEDKHLYRIVRDPNQENAYSTLSEGEKTLITFLYFLECCKGCVSKEDTTSEMHKIIVIDDPISSLSHNYVYDIAHFIHKELIKSQFGQVLVLTHNLYFFHELSKFGGSSKKLFRISKNVITSIEEIKDKDIQNDYQAYWQIIRDADSGQANKVILANSMRNIFEHFASFICKNDHYKDILQSLDLEDNHYRVFTRFMDRESHSDGVNISDCKDIDETRFKNMFKEVFDKMGFLEHYDAMMAR